MQQINATHGSDKSPRLHCCCDKAALRFLCRRDMLYEFKTGLKSCDISQRQIAVSATMICTCHTRRFVAATCRSDLSHSVSRP